MLRLENIIGQQAQENRKRLDEKDTEIARLKSEYAAEREELKASGTATQRDYQQLKKDHEAAVTDLTKARQEAAKAEQALVDAKGKDTMQATEIERLKAADPDAKIWEDIEKDFHADCAAKGITPLKRKMWQKVIAGAASIAADERVAPAFKNGVPEISVFAVLNGVPCKCRLDYLRFGREGGRPVAIITDLKSFTNMAELPPEYRAEPALALDGNTAGSSDGMDFVRQLFKDAPSRMSEHAVLVLEIGNEAAHFMAAFPELEVAWLDTSAGDDQVLLTTREALLALSMAS